MAGDQLDHRGGANSPHLLLEPINISTFCYHRLENQKHTDDLGFPGPFDLFESSRVDALFYRAVIDEAG